MGGNAENIGAEALVKDLVRRKAWDIGGIACFRLVEGVPHLLLVQVNINVCVLGMPVNLLTHA
jgi:hypothetical protein